MKIKPLSFLGLSLYTWQFWTKQSFTLVKLYTCKALPFLVGTHFVKWNISGNSRKCYTFAPKIWIPYPLNVIPFLLVDKIKFARSHLDYGNIMYDQPSNSTFSNKFESVQYNVALVITGAIRGSSRENLFQELGLDHLHHRRWMKRLCVRYEFLSNISVKQCLQLETPLEILLHSLLFLAVLSTLRILLFHVSQMTGITSTPKSAIQLLI